jgi:hypothetical protein
MEFVEAYGCELGVKSKPASSAALGLKNYFQEEK